MKTLDIKLKPRLNYVVIRGEVIIPLLGLTSESIANDAKFAFYVDVLNDTNTDLKVDDRVKLDLALYGNQMANNKLVIVGNENSREKLTKAYVDTNSLKNKDYKELIKDQRKIKVIEYYLIQENWISAIDLNEEVVDDKLLPLL